MTDISDDFLKDVVKRSIKERDLKVFPTNEDKKEMIEIVIDFVKKRKRKIYGGQAINEILKERDDKFKIYEDDAVADIDFYSSNPVQDLHDLCNIYHDKGYLYILGTQGEHDRTYYIAVEFEKVCDISYVPSQVYNNIPYKEINGFHYVNIPFLLVDLYYQLANPYGSFAIDRLEKTYHRTKLIEKVFSLRKPTDTWTQKSVDKDTQNVLNFLMTDFIKGNQEILLMGPMAYNIYMKEADSKQMIVDRYEVTSLNFYKDAVETLQKLKNKFPSGKFTTKEYVSYMEFYGHQIDILYNDKEVINFYSHMDRCIPNKVNDDISVVNYHYMLMMLYSFLSRAKMIKGDLSRYRWMIYNLVEARKKYIEKNQLKGTEDMLFQILQTECSGTYISAYRKNKLKIKERLKKRIAVRYNYDPSRKHVNDAPQIRHKNISGNLIIKEENKLIQVKKVSLSSNKSSKKQVKECFQLSKKSSKKLTREAKKSTLEAKKSTLEAKKSIRTTKNAPRKVKKPIRDTKNASRKVKKRIRATKNASRKVKKPTRGAKKPTRSAKRA
jgi:hypothetical protein